MGNSIDNKENEQVETEKVILQEITKPKEMTNKRIDFDKKAMKRIETMLPVYSEEAGVQGGNELYSFVVRKAIDSLFEGEFKKKLDEL